MNKELKKILLLLLILSLDAVILSIVLGIPLLDCRASVEHAEDKYGSTDVERPGHRIGNLTLGSYALNAQPSEDVGEEVADKRASVAEQALDRVRRGLLLIVDHIADHHLKWLHCHIDRGIEQHKHHSTESQRRLDGHLEATRVRQERHNDNGHYSTYVEVWLAATPLTPSLVAQRAHDRLHYHTHQWGQHPEEAQRMGIGTQRCEDAADICTLQGVGNLHAEESKAQIPHLPK